MYTTMLELAISMVFLFLMLSAASSAIQEIIANIFRWRAKTLEKGIEGLLRSEKVKDELYQLPLLQGLFSPNARGQLTHKPSYIPSSTFALAVLHWAETKKVDLTNSVPPSAGQPAAKSDSPPSDVAELLQSLLRGTKDAEEQRKRIEDWFDNSMDRISGWYKRKSHAALWVIGILVCLFVNADSISLAKAFWNDQTLRAATVTAATEHVKNVPKEERTSTTSSNPAPTTPGGAAAGGQTSHSDDAAFKRLNDVRRELTKVDIPLGWCWYGNKGELQEKCFPFFNNPVTFTFTGDRGNAEYDYWIVANYEDGKSSLAGPFSAKKAPDALTDKNYVGITWQAVTGAKAYDVLRSSGTPLGDCNCAVARGVSSLTASDKSQTLKQYKFATLSQTDEGYFHDPQVIVTGKPGKKTYKYWIVPNYKDGRGSPAGPFAATNAPDTLSDTNYIVISWKPVQSANSYDILRTGDDKLPTGECDCAVKTNVPGPSISDNSLYLQPYKYGTVLQHEDAAIPDPRLVPPFGLEWLLKLLGIAVTALAISQGAPFWFDLLQKAVNLRLAGDAPDEKQKKK